MCCSAVQFRQPSVRRGLADALSPPMVPTLMHGVRISLCCAGGEAEAEEAPKAAAPAAEQPPQPQQPGQLLQKRLNLDAAFVDLGSLDLSIMDRPNRMPPLAKVGVGGAERWVHCCMGCTGLP